MRRADERARPDGPFLLADPIVVQARPRRATRPRGAGFAELQEYHRLNVRVLGYKRSALPKPNAKTRLDVITVEECAPAKHSLVVPHNHWMLVDSDDVILGRAGAKLVHGKAIEDTPSQARRRSVPHEFPRHRHPVLLHTGRRPRRYGRHLDHPSLRRAEPIRRPSS